MPVELIAKIIPKNSAFVNIVDAANAGVDTSGFTGNLTVAEDTVQKALDRIDLLTSFLNIDGGAASNVYGPNLPVIDGGNA